MCVYLCILVCITLCILEHMCRLSGDSRPIGNTNGSFQQPTYHTGLYASRTAHRAATDHIRAYLVSVFQGTGGKCIL